MAASAGGLRTLLGFAQQDEQLLALAGGGGHAYVSAALRPYAIAALVDLDENARARPTLIVVGDDRAARDLAGDLRAWLAPRRVRYYPSRGVAYESHLAPPAHLVGLRVAAFDALLGAPADDEAAAREGQPVVVVSAVALSEKVPDPQLRPHSFNLRVGELIDLDECAEALVGAGYERAEQVEERGQFALRGGLLDIFPATEDRAVRVDTFDVEIESLRWFSTFTQRSLGEVSEVEIAPAAELAVEHRELAEIAAATGAFPGGQARESERADIAELLPLERFGELLDMIGKDAEVVLGAEEELEPALADHWSDVCAAFGEHDAERLYVNPERIRQSLKQRTRIWISAHSSDQPIELRGDMRIHAMELRAGLLELIGEGKGPREPGFRRRVARGRILLHQQSAQRREPGPARHRVVGDIEQTAGFEPAPDESDHRLPVGRADPAVDPVQAHDVEVRHRRVVQQFVEARLAELYVFESGRAGKRARSRDMGRVEVRGEHVRVRVGRGNEIGGESLAAAEIAIGDRLSPAARNGDALGERREAQDRRRLHPAEIMNVGGVGDVAGTPISHTLHQMCLFRVTCSSRIVRARDPPWRTRDRDNWRGRSCVPTRRGRRNRSRR